MISSEGVSSQMDSTKSLEKLVTQFEKTDDDKLILDIALLLTKSVRNEPAELRDRALNILQNYYKPDENIKNVAVTLKKYKFYKMRSALRG